MRYLLDTDSCIYAIKREPRIVERLREHGPEDFGISAVTIAELWFGAVKSSRPKQTRDSVDAFLVPFDVLPFGSAAAEAYAEARLHLERKGQPIGERDLLIAATAISLKLTIVTHNLREFSRVPHLRFEDWR